MDMSNLIQDKFKTDTAEQRAADVIARLTGQANALSTRGRCRKCGGDGHLTYECMNTIKTKSIAKRTGANVEEISSKLPRLC